MGEVHIYAPAAETTAIEQHRCPTCNGVTEILVSTFEWYAPHSVCFGCGDEWHGSEMAPRPFARGWRQRNIEQATRRAKAIGLTLSIGAAPQTEGDET